MKWEPIWHPSKPDGQGEPIGWVLRGKHSTVKILQGADGTMWVGLCEELFDLSVVLESATAVSAQREFLKSCLRRARALTAELEGVWNRTEGK